MTKFKADPRKVAIAFMFIVITVWATTFVMIKGLVAYTGAFYIVFCRSAIAALFALMVILIRKGKEKPDRNSILKGSIGGLLLGAGYLAQTAGLRYTSSGHSAFISCSAVSFVPLFLFMFFRQKVKPFEIISLGITITGLFLLSFDPGKNINVGDLITMITMISSSLIIVFNGRFLKNIDLGIFLFFQYLVATVMSLAGLAMTSGHALQLSLKSIIILLYLGVIVTFVCQSSITLILKHLEPLHVGLLLLLEPIIATFLAYFISAESVALKEMIGAGVILTGIAYYQLMEKRSQARRACRCECSG